MGFCVVVHRCDLALPFSDSFIVLAVVALTCVFPFQCVVECFVYSSFHPHTRPSIYTLSVIGLCMPTGAQASYPLSISVWLTKSQWSRPMWSAMPMRARVSWPTKRMMSWRQRNVPLRKCKRLIRPVKPTERRRCEMSNACTTDSRAPAGVVSCKSQGFDQGSVCFLIAHQVLIVGIL
jgi:hypothetical protein